MASQHPSHPLLSNTPVTTTLQSQPHHESHMMFRVLRLSKPIPSRRSNHIPYLPKLEKELRNQVDIVVSMQASHAEVLSATQSDMTKKRRSLRALVLGEILPWEGEGVIGGVASSIVLAAAFGNIYLGESFKALVTAVNSEGHNMTVTSFRIEMNTPSNRVYMLADSTESSVLTPTDNVIEHLVEFPLSEVGSHSLTCSAVYKHHYESESRSIRQHFRFNVLVPIKLSIFTEPVYRESGNLIGKNYQISNEKKEFLARIQVTNVMTSPIVNLSLRLRADPDTLYKIVPLNLPADSDLAHRSVVEESESDYQVEEKERFLRSMSFPSTNKGVQPGDPAKEDELLASLLNNVSIGLEPGDTNCFVHYICRDANKLAQDSVDVRNGPTAGSLIGTVDLSWRSVHGEDAQLTFAGNVFEPAPSDCDIEISVISCPRNLAAFQPFDIQCRVVNHTSKPHRLYLQVRRDLVGEIVPVGVSGVSLGEIPPYSFQTPILRFLALSSGVHSLYGMRVVDIDTKASYNAEAPQLLIA